MSQLIPVPINPPPGVVVTESDRVADGRWILPFDKIRFVHGRPQKVGGNIRVTSTPMSGTPRATLCWNDFLQNGYVACGTYRKLYAFDSSYTLNDITPFRATGTLGTNPFTTTSGSNSVEVAQSGHGVNVGDTAIYSGATAFNGVTMNGTFIVVTVIDTSHYTVTATTTATGSGAGGGASVTYEYEVAIGTELGAFGQGWGTGPWGLGTWGTARGSSTIFFEPRVWSFDYFGQILVATYNGGALWFFDPTQAEPWPRAVATFNSTAVTGAPTNIRAIFVSPERYVFALCDSMVVNVSSQGDPTTWIPATTNTAFARTLQVGSKLVGGKALQPFISMVWSDNAAYLFQYTGSQFIYNSSMVGRDCGLISTNAVVAVDGFAYWMAVDNFFFYNGSVMPMPNSEDIRKYVFDSIPETLAFQSSAVYVPRYHEIWFFYTTIGNTNPTNYVIFHINDQCWSVGNANFYSSAGVTAGRASGSHFTLGDTSPIMAGTDGYLYNHDVAADNEYDDNGNPLTWELWLSPYALREGMQNLDVEGILFDFFEQSGNITTTVNTYDRLTDAAPMDTETEIIPDAQAGLTDFRVSGRYLSLGMSSSDPGNYMRLGKPVAFVRPSAMRR
jgi:hypothetical protein